MPPAIIAALVLLGIAVVTAIAVGLVRRILLRYAILDHPNDRSSHRGPTPRGGGIALVAVILPAWLIAVLRIDPPDCSWQIAPGVLGLAAISWLDDIRGVGAIPRLFVHLIVAATAVAVLKGPVFQGLLPPLLDNVAAVFLLVWFVNLFNFMDGIDGLSAVEAAAIGLGLFLFGLVLGEFGVGQWQALAIAGAALGFLIWNWSPARVFLGDVGSITIGFMLGWLLLQAATQGAWAAALILVLYYLADGTITLLRRLVAGDNILTPHRQHFYQQAVRRGHSHAKVAGLVALLNVVLIAHALVVVANPQSATLPALLSASALVTGVLAWMGTAPSTAPNQKP